MQIQKENEVWSQITPKFLSSQMLVSQMRAPSLCARAEAAIRKNAARGLEGAGSADMPLI